MDQMETPGEGLTAENAESAEKVLIRRALRRTAFGGPALRRLCVGGWIGEGALPDGALRGTNGLNAGTNGRGRGLACIFFHFSLALDGERCFIISVKP